jgi:hypothetical protein
VTLKVCKLEYHYLRGSGDNPGSANSKSLSALGSIGGAIGKASENFHISRAVVDV